MNDEILVTLYDEETDSEHKFELINQVELDGKIYYMIAEPESGALESESEEAIEAMAEEFMDGFDDEEEEETDAYLFVRCGKKEAEFLMTLNGEEFPVTSMMSDEEYDAAVEALELDDDYDIIVDDEV